MASLTLAIFGATGATGLSLVAEALRRGHGVRAFCRPAIPWAGPSVAEERDRTILVARGPRTTIQAVWPSLAGQNE